MITMLTTPTPPTPFHPSAVLSRDPRRSPGAATKSSEIAPRQRPDQPVEWPQPATIVPTLPFKQEAEMVGPPGIMAGKVGILPNGSGGSGVLARPLAADKDRHSAEIFSPTPDASSRAMP